MKQEEAKKKPEKELSEEEFTRLVSDLEEFEGKIYFALAETDKFEVIPTIDPSGRPIPKEQLDLLLRECKRLGYTPIYRIELNPETFILYNPKTKKIGYVKEGMH